MKCVISNIVGIAILGGAAPAAWGQTCDFPRYGGTVSLAEEQDEAGSAVALGADGSVVVAGMYAQGPGAPCKPVDFNPFEGVDLHPCHGGEHGGDDIFVSKYNPDGSYGWTRTVGAEGRETAMGVAIDNQGNVYHTGYFESSTVDFDPTEGEDWHLNRSDCRVRCSAYIFLTRLNADGSYAWTHTFGDPRRGASATGRGVAVDASGNVLMTGDLRGKGATIDFDPGPGEAIGTSQSAFAAFLASYAPDGAFRWVKIITDRYGTAHGYAVGVGLDGSILLTGEFKGGLDFKPGKGKDRHQGHDDDDVFVTRFRPDGSYHWTRTFGGDSVYGDTGKAVAADRDGAVLVAGYFHRTVDFDPGPGVHERTDPGKKGIFLSKFSKRGVWLWSWVPANTPENDLPLSVSLDAARQVYVTGSFKQRMDFNPDGGGDWQSPNGRSAVLVTALRPDGSYGWTGVMGGAYATGGRGIASDPDSRLVLTGEFYRSVDFDPTEGVDIHTVPGQFLNSNLFVTRLLCGGCDDILGHRVEPLPGGVRAEVNTTLAAGRVKVRCRGNHQKRTQWADIDGEGIAAMTVEPLPPGRVACVVRKVKDPAGKTACKGRYMLRDVVVK